MRSIQVCSTAIHRISSSPARASTAPLGSAPAAIRAERAAYVLRSIPSTGVRGTGWDGSGPPGSWGMRGWDMRAAANLPRTTPFPFTGGDGREILVA